MKTRIKKIIILVSALFFVSTGVALAHDLKRGHYKSQKHAQGYHKKVHDQHSGWHNKHHKPRSHYRDKYHHRKVHRVHHHNLYYDRHAPHYEWHNKHFKHRRHHRDRYRHREVHKVQHYDPHAPHEEAIVAVKVKEPGFKFAIVVKEHR